MFQTCFHDQKVPRKDRPLHFLFFMLNTMIRNNKIKNIFDIINVSKYILPNKCTQKKIK